MSCKDNVVFEIASALKRPRKDKIVTSGGFNKTTSGCLNQIGLGAEIEFKWS